MAEALPAAVVDAVEAHLAARTATANVQGVSGKAGSKADPNLAAAAVVLDVLRESGWIDPQQALQLRQETERLHELLDLVVRDHRAREAVAAMGEMQQRDWLVPLLRAAAGIEQGTLEAKATLRSTLQQVPPDVLASAGLRPDAAPAGNAGRDGS
jgi:hypothetical protein